MLNPWRPNNGPHGYWGPITDPRDTYTGEYLIPEWAQRVDTRKGYLQVATLE